MTNRPTAPRIEPIDLDDVTDDELRTTLGGALTLAEFALGDQPNARFTLSWRRAGSELLVEGVWRESTEGNRVTMTGALSPVGARSAEPHPTEPQSTEPHPK
jgi:hypothetical protein